MISRDLNKRIKSRKVRSRVVVDGKSEVPQGIPMSTMAYLGFVDETISYVPGAQAYYVWDYRINSAYRPESTNAFFPARFNDMAQLYRRYRVLEVEIELTVSNREAFAVIVSTCPSTVQINSSVTTVGSALTIGEQDYRKTVMLSAKGGGSETRTIIQRIDLRKLSGQPSRYRVDDMYAALNNANPASIYYFTISLAGTANLTLGVTALMKIVFHTLWTEKTTDIPNTLQRVKEDNEILREQNEMLLERLKSSRK